MCEEDKEKIMKDDTRALAWYRRGVVAEPCFVRRALRIVVDRVETAHRRVVTLAPVESRTCCAGCRTATP